MSTIAPNGVRAAEYPHASHLLVHLSDTHLLADDEHLYGAVDSEATLRLILDQVVASQMRPAAFVITGDLTDRGEPGAYRKLRAILEPVADTVGARIIWAMGNHDARPAMRSELLDSAPTQQTVDAVAHVDGLRIVTVDTSVPGHHHGELDQHQLDWLATELATPAPHGTILALHHPPVPCVLDLAVLVELRDQHRLAEVLRGSDVRSILAGHLHYSTTAVFAGIPVAVASATCYTQDLSGPAGSLRGRNGAQGFNLVHVYPETIVHSFATVGDYATVGEHVSPEETRRRLAQAGVHIRGPQVTVAPTEPVWGSSSPGT